MQEYLKNKIIERVKQRVMIMTWSMNVRNAWFKQSLNKGMESKQFPEREIENHFKEYRDLMFKYEALDWEINKLLSELGEHIQNGEFENFRWTVLPCVENEYMVEVLTKSELD